ncbi:MAG: hypothetical protein ACPGOV_15790 [Magnetovibrionaceae bacterium]
MSGLFLMALGFGLGAFGLGALGLAGEAQANDGISTSVSGEVNFYAMAFQDDPSNGADDDALFLSPQAKLSLGANLTDTIDFNLDLFGSLSNQENGHIGIFHEPGEEHRQPAFLDATQGYFSYLGESITLKVGKAVVENGFAELASSADRFGRADGSNPQLTRDIGVFQARADVFVGDDTVTMMVMPFHEKSYVPAEKSRWAGSSGDADFQSLTLPTGNLATGSARIQDRFHSTNPKNAGYLVKYEGRRQAFDFYGLAHHGPSVYPVVRQRVATDALYEKVDPLATSVAAGVSTVVDAWKFYGEGIAQLTDAGRDEDFVRYTLGASYRMTDLANAIGLDEIKPILEWSGDESFDGQREGEYIVDSSEARPLSNAIVAQIEIQHNSDVSYGLGGAYHVEENDFSITLGAEYRPTDNLTFNLSAAYYEGKDDTHFGRWKENENIMFAAGYTF